MKASLFLPNAINLTFCAVIISTFVVRYLDSIMTGALIQNVFAAEQAGSVLPSQNKNKYRFSRQGSNS